MIYSVSPNLPSVVKSHTAMYVTLIHPHDQLKAKDVDMENVMLWCEVSTEVCMKQGCVYRTKQNINQSITISNMFIHSSNYLIWRLSKISLTWVSFVGTLSQAQPAFSGDLPSSDPMSETPSRLFKKFSKL